MKNLKPQTAIKTKTKISLASAVLTLISAVTVGTILGISVIAIPFLIPGPGQGSLRATIGIDVDPTIPGDYGICTEVSDGDTSVPAAITYRVGANGEIEIVNFDLGQLFCRLTDLVNEGICAITELESFLCEVEEFYEEYPIVFRAARIVAGPVRIGRGAAKPVKTIIATVFLRNTRTGEVTTQDASTSISDCDICNDNINNDNINNDNINEEE